MGDEAPVTTTEQPESAAQPALTNQPGTAVAKPKEAEQQPEKTPNFGKQFAALGRRESELRRLEAKIQTERAEVESHKKELDSLSSLSVDELLERVVQKRGMSVDDVIKGYIEKKTGAPSGEQAIKESKDPAVQALYRELEERKRAESELKSKLAAKEKEEAELRTRATVQMVQTECLQSATEAWKEDGDLPDFFDDKQELSSAVFRFCAEQVTAYEQRHGFSPDGGDIQKLIKAAPEILLSKLRETPRGKRILARKSEKKPELMSAPSRVSSVRMKPVGGEPEPQKIKTRYDNSDAIAKARASLPERIEFGARAKP